MKPLKRCMRSLPNVCLCTSGVRVVWASRRSLHRLPLISTGSSSTFGRFSLTQSTYADCRASPQIKQSGAAEVPSHDRRRHTPSG